MQRSAVAQRHGCHSIQSINKPFSNQIALLLLTVSDALHSTAFYFDRANDTTLPRHKVTDLAVFSIYPHYSDVDDKCCIWLNRIMLHLRCLTQHYMDTG